MSINKIHINEDFASYTCLTLELRLFLSQEKQEQENQPYCVIFTKNR